MWIKEERVNNVHFGPCKPCCVISPGMSHPWKGDIFHKAVGNTGMQATILMCFAMVTDASVLEEGGKHIGNTPQ